MRINKDSKSRGKSITEAEIKTCIGYQRIKCMPHHFAVSISNKMLLASPLTCMFLFHSY